MTRPSLPPIRFGVCLRPGTPEVLHACRGVQGATLVPIAEPGDIAGHLPALDAIVLQNGSYTAAVAAAAARAPRLRWVQSAATGIDAFQRHGLPPGVRLTNAGDVWAPCVADHAMALVLGALRGLPQAERDRSARRWDRPGLATRLGSLYGRRVLLLGLGPVGREIARRMHGFDTQLVALTRAPGRAAPLPHPASIEPLDQLMPRLAEADIVVVALPLVAATRHLIGREALAAMRDDAVLVNISRGELIDEPALIETLSAGRLRGVGLDVTAVEPLPANSPLWGFGTVLVTPHAAAFDAGPAQARLGALCRANLERFVAGTALLNGIDAAAHAAP